MGTIPSLLLRYVVRDYLGGWSYIFCLHIIFCSLVVRKVLPYMNCKKVRVCTKTQFYRKEIIDEDSSYFLTRLINATRYLKFIAIKYNI